MMTEDGVLTVHGKRLGTGSESFGELRSWADAQEDFDELNCRFERDGYLYLPGLLDRDTVGAARQTMLEALASLEYVDTEYPLSDGVAKRERFPYRRWIWSGFPRTINRCVRRSSKGQ